MSLIQIAESDDFVVDYDPDIGMYRVSVFKDCNFQDEFWFDAYESDALNKQIAKPPYDRGNPDWHIICCPSCDRVFWNSGGYMKYEPEYCEKCGQKINWSDWRSYTKT